MEEIILKYSETCTVQAKDIQKASASIHDNDDDEADAIEDGNNLMCTVEHVWYDVDTLIGANLRCPH